MGQDLASLPINCSTCPYFAATAPASITPDMSVSEVGKALAGDKFTHGNCVRFPRTERKRPDEVCGEHPEFPKRTVNA